MFGFNVCSTSIDPLIFFLIVSIIQNIIQNNWVVKIDILGNHHMNGWVLADLVITRHLHLAYLEKHFRWGNGWV